MRHELFITQTKLDKLTKRDKLSSFQAALDNIDITITRNSNFFEATEYILEDSVLSKMDKVYFLDAFMEEGGVVKFLDCLFTNFQVLALLENLKSHKFISEEEYKSYRAI